MILKLRPSLSVLLMLMISLPCLSARAQNGSETALSLDAAMKGAHLPAGRSAIAVDAKNIVSASAVTEAETDPERIAWRYRQITRRFHGLTAIAPSSITVLNGNPEGLNPYAQMSAQDDLRFFLALLSPSQWEQLIGAGLRLQDLSDPVQKSLLAAMFPPSGLFIRAADGQKHTITGAEILSGRLKLSRRVLLMLPIPTNGSQARGFISMSGSETAKDSLAQELPAEDPAADFTLCGVPVVVAEPNRLKDGQMDFSETALAAIVDLPAECDVATAVAAVSRVCGRVISVDPRYAGRKVTLTGSSSIQCGDLLESLAFCLGGCYRRVGPVWILTNDIEGYGTRLEKLRRIKLQSQAFLQGRVEEMAWRFSSGNLPLEMREGTPITERQRELLKDGNVDLKFSELSPQQQAEVRRMAQIALLGGTHLDGYPYTQDSKIGLFAAPTLQIAFDGRPLLMTLDSVFQTGLVFAGAPASNIEPAHSSQETNSGDARKDALRLTAVLRAFSHRILLAEPKTKDDIERIVKVSTPLGVNSIWWDMTDAPLAKFGEALPTFVTDSAARLKAAGVNVLLCVSASYQGEIAPGMRELDIVGLDSRQYYAFQLQTVPNLPKLLSRRWAENFVFAREAPETPAIYRRFLRAAAASHQIDGIVWRDNLRESDFGYNLNARVDFIKRFQIDPIDIPGVSPFRSTNKSPLPDFPWSDEIARLRDEWGDYPSVSQKRFMAAIFDGPDAVKQPSPSYFEHSGYGVAPWYGSDDSDKRGPNDLCTIAISPAETISSFADKLESSSKLGTKGGFVIDLLADDASISETSDPFALLESLTRSVHNASQ